jgi:hypothetical protein
MQECKLSNVKIGGNTLSFNTTCVEDGLRMTGSTEMTFGVDSFTGVSTMKGDGAVSSTMKMSARRVGECK